MAVYQLMLWPKGIDGAVIVAKSRNSDSTIICVLAMEMSNQKAQ